MNGNEIVTNKGKKTIVFGAGPAGLSIAHTLLANGFQAQIVERSHAPGGLSRSLEYGGGIVDMGPHVIGMEYPVVAELFKDILRDQTHDFQLRTTMTWKGHGFTYPPKPREIISKLGFQSASAIAGSCAVGRVRSIYKPVENYREMACAKYGRSLSESCIEPYIERLWGLPCDQISVEWKPGRFVRSSVRQWLANAVTKKGDETVTHPNLGMGQFYTKMADRVVSMGGEIGYEQEVRKLEHAGSKIERVSLRSINEPEKEAVEIEGADTRFVSTLPLSVLLTLLDPLPPVEIQELGELIKFRNTVLIYVVADKESVPEDHIRYLNDPKFRISRVTNYSQWSPGMKSSAKGEAILGCEIWTGFDGYWAQDDEEITQTACEDLVKLGVRVLDSSLPRVVRVPHSHPVITLESQKANKRIHEYLSRFTNLTLAGRAGSFEYADQNKILNISIRTAKEIIASMC